MADLEVSVKQFRESFRGFNKDDVTDFISSISRKFSESEDSYKLYISRLEEKLCKYLKKQSDLTLFTDNIDVNKKIANLNIFKFSEADDNESYKSNLESSRAIVNELSDEIGSSKKEIAFLDYAIKTLETKSGIKLSDIFDATTLKIRNAETAVVIDNTPVSKTTLTETIPAEKAAAAENLKTVAAELESEKIKNSQLRAELEKLKNETDSNRTLSSMYESEIETLKKYKDDFDALKSEYDVLQKKLIPAEPQNDEERTMYKSVTAELGEIIFSAKKKSDIIIQNAKNEADRIIMEANENKNLTIMELGNRINELKEKYKNLKSEFTSALETYKTAHEFFLSSMLETDDMIDIIYKKLQ